MWEQINALLTQSSSRVFTGIANFLPGLLALMVIFLITVTLVAILRIILRRFLRSIDFDLRVVRWGFPELAEWSQVRATVDPHHVMCSDLDRRLDLDGHSRAGRRVFA